MKSYTAIPTSTTRLIALLRMTLGGLLVYQAISIMDPQFLATLPGQLNTMTLNNPYTVLHFLVYMVLIPQSHIVGSILVIGTLTVGGAMMLGFVTRGFALLGFLYAVFLFALSAHMGWAYQHTAILLGFAFFAMMLLNAGQYYGLDKWLFKQPEPAPAKRSYKARGEGSLKAKQAAQVRQVASAMKKQPKQKVVAMPPNLLDEDDDDEVEDNYRGRYDFDDDDE